MRLPGWLIALASLFELLHLFCSEFPKIRTCDLEDVLPFPSIECAVAREVFINEGVRCTRSMRHAALSSMMISRWGCSCPSICLLGLRGRTKVRCFGRYVSVVTVCPPFSDSSVASRAIREFVGCSVLVFLDESAGVDAKFVESLQILSLRFWAALSCFFYCGCFRISTAPARSSISQVMASHVEGA